MASVRNAWITIQNWTRITDLHNLYPFERRNDGRMTMEVSKIRLVCLITIRDLPKSESEQKLNKVVGPRNETHSWSYVKQK